MLFISISMRIGCPMNNIEFSYNYGSSPREVFSYIHMFFLCLYGGNDFQNLNWMFKHDILFYLNLHTN
jgi:hypothetical protein